MKKLITLLLLVISNISYAQNWQTVTSSKTVHFGYEGTNSLGYSVLVYEGLRIDSLVVEGTDSLFFNYTTYYSEDGINRCGEDDTSWIGTHIRVENNGYTYFLSTAGDTFLINTLASKGDNWNFSTTIVATLDTITLDTLFDNITDSVKTISLSNGDELKISKNYGLVKGLRFGYYPLDNTNVKLVGIENIGGIQNLTAQEVYDYQIGDEFHYEKRTEDYNMGTPIFGYSKLVEIITESPVVGHFEIDTLANTSNQNDEFDFYKYNVLRTKEIYTRCPLGSRKKIFQEGLGIIEDHFYNDGFSSVTKLVYYKKVNGEEWGVPLSNNEKIENYFSIYPNPFLESFTINFLKEGSKLLKNKILIISVYDVVGKKVVHNSFSKLKDQYVINTSNLEKGTYIVDIEGVGRRKMVKK